MLHERLGFFSLLLFTSPCMEWHKLLLFVGARVAYDIPAVEMLLSEPSLVVFLSKALRIVLKQRS